MHNGVSALDVYIERAEKEKRSKVNHRTLEILRELKALNITDKKRLVLLRRMIEKQALLLSILAYYQFKQDLISEVE